MKKGFTLVELLGVILIIALLSIVMFPNVINHFFATSERLDKEVEALVIEAAKDYYAVKKDDISDIDYCMYILTLQEEGLLAYDLKNSEGKIISGDTIVKIGKNGSSYEVGSCNISVTDIEEAARKYYNAGNVSIADGESKCIRISDLQKSFYLSPVIQNATGDFYDANTSIKLSNNGSLSIAYGENC